jgi:hypothetical protein
MNVVVSKPCLPASEPGGEGAPASLAAKLGTPEVKAAGGRVGGADFSHG